MTEETEQAGAGESPAEVEGEEPHTIEFKIEVTTAKKWWNDKKVNEEGEETVEEVESLATTSCSVDFLGLQTSESEAVALTEGEEFNYGVSATYTVEEEGKYKLPSTVLNNGLILTVFNANKEAVATAEVSLEALLNPGNTLVEGSAELGLVEDTEDAKSLCLNYSVSVSEALQTKEGGLIGRVNGLTLSPVPESLKKAMEESSVSPDFTVGLQVPGKVDKELLEFRNSIVKDNSVTWSKEVKFYIQPDDVSEMKKLLKKSTFDIEVARYMPSSSEMGDPKASAYFFYSKYSMSKLLDPGAQSTHIDANCTVPSYDEEEGLKLALLANPEYGEKAAPFPEESEGEEKENVWVRLGSTLSFDLTLDYPLLKLWSLPENTMGKLSQIITVKEETPKPVDKMETKQKAFINQCKTVAKILVRDYGDAFEEDGGSGTQKKVIFHLNKSGAYMKMKEFLKKSAIEIIEQRIGSTTVIKQMDSHALLNEAYSILLSCVQDALKEMKSKDENENAKDDKAVLEKMKRLADEYEVNGNLEIAEKYHVDRISNSQKLTQNLWYDYGQFCLRSNMVDKAEECFREEVSSFPGNLDALLALSGLLLSQSKTPKGNKYLLDQAEIIIHTALRQEAEESGNSSLIWAMLALLYSKSKGLDSDACQNCIFKATREKKKIKLGVAELEVDGMTNLVLQLLDFSLPLVALDALAICESIPEIDRLLCKVQIHYLLEEYTKGLEVLAEVLKLCEHDDIRPFILEGKIHSKLEDYESAIASFTHVMSINANACTLDVLLTYGKALLTIGSESSMKTAQDVFVFACQKCPCASTWLGCAITCIKLGDLSNAEIALTEASTLDAKNPGVWAYTCLSSLKLGRSEVAESALEFALLENLTDVDLLQSMAVEFASASMHRQAVQVLRKSISIKGTSQALKLLGDSLFLLGSKVEAMNVYDSLLSDYQNDMGKEMLVVLQEQVKKISVEFGLNPTTATS